MLNSDPMSYKPARLLRPWNSPGKNTGASCRFLLQGIFLTQGLNPGFLHYRQILYRWCPRKVLTRVECKHNLYTHRETEIFL